MYNDFLRARKKLKRKCNYTHPRQRNSLSERLKRMQRTLLILLRSTVTEQQRHDNIMKVNNLYKNIHDATSLATPRPRCPCLNSLMGYTSEKKEMYINQALSLDSRYEDPVDASILLALIRILFKKEVEKFDQNCSGKANTNYTLDKEQDTELKSTRLPGLNDDKSGNIHPHAHTETISSSSHEDDTVSGSENGTNLHTVHDNNHDGAFEVDFKYLTYSGAAGDSVVGKYTPEVLYHGNDDSTMAFGDNPLKLELIKSDICGKSEHPENQPFTSLRYCDELDTYNKSCAYSMGCSKDNQFDSCGQSELPDNELATSSRCCDEQLETYNKSCAYSMACSKDNKLDCCGQSELPDNELAISSRCCDEQLEIYNKGCAYYMGCSKDYTNIKEYDSTSEEREQDEYLALSDWNDFCGDRSRIFETDEDDFSDEESDTPINRIIYNTTPARSTSPATPVFVCSVAALMNAGTVQFGEPTSGIAVATNFNVNAINNKDRLWKETKADHVTDDLRNKTEKEENLDTRLVNPVAATLKRIGAYIMSSNSLLSREKWWSSMLQALAIPGLGTANNKSVPTAMLALILIAMCVVFAVATSSLISLFGIFMDVILHAALLSLVIIIAVVVCEAHEDASSPFIQGCSTFLHNIGFVGPPENTKRIGGFRGQCSRKHDDKEDNGNDADDGDDNDSHSPQIGQINLDANDSGLETMSRGQISDISPSHSSRFKKKAKKERIEICEASTMTDGAIMTAADSNGLQPLFSFAERMPIDCRGTQTESILNDDDEEAIVNYLPINEEGDVMTSSCDERRKRSVGAQANIDAQGIYDQTERLKQRHQENLKRMQRKFLAIRRRLRRDAHDLKTCDQQKGDFLAKLQLTLPALQREKNRLTAEKFQFERQFMDQKKKNQDLVGRITKLNQQFQILGQTQQPTLPFPWRPPNLNLNLNHAFGASNLFVMPQPELQQPQHHKQQNKVASNLSTTQTTTQITLSQPKTPPSVPNKWLSSLQQQQQPHHPAVLQPTLPPQQQQQQQHLQIKQQQARLPIFQLLRNSVPSSPSASIANSYSHSSEEGNATLTAAASMPIRHQQRLLENNNNNPN